MPHTQCSSLRPSQLLEGNLQDLLTMVNKKKINVTWRLLWSIANGTATALRYLHFENGTQVIHRDVKVSQRSLFMTSQLGSTLNHCHLTLCSTQAENLLLNKSFVAKLTDFGLSRMIDPGKNSKIKTMTMCGTPSWVAPEIFKGEPYNQRIDVYRRVVHVVNVSRSGD